MTACSFARAADELIPLSISVNTELKGDFFVILRDGFEVLINREDIATLGLIDSGKSEKINEKFYNSLEEYREGLIYRIDLQTLTLELDVAPPYLQRNTRSLAKEAVVKSNPFKIDSAFLNASANARGVNDKSYEAKEFPLELVVSAQDLLLQTNFTYLREDIDGQFVTGAWYRGMSNITRDFSGRLERLVLGDFSATSGELGGSGVFGGISYGKKFNMASSFTRYSSVSVDGVLQTPSKVSLYANGNLIRSLQLPAGEFVLEDLPDLYGAGELLLEIEDSFGRKTQKKLDYYVSTRLLRQGLHDFNYSLGFRRINLNKPDSGYQTKPDFLAYHRYGVAEHFTAGYRLELNEELVNHGPILNLLLGSLGDVELRYAYSKYNDVVGFAGLAKYNYSSRYFHMRLAYRENQRNYTTLSSASSFNLPGQIRSIGVGVHGTRFGGLSLGYSETRFYADETQKITALNYSRRLGKKVNFFLRAQDLKYGTTESKSIFAAISVTLDKQVSGGVSYSDNSDIKEGTAYLQKNAPIGKGTGFRFRTRQVENSAGEKELPGDLNILAKTRYNSLNATYYKESGLSSYNVQFASTLAFIDNQFFITRPVYDSFGLVKVGKLDDVKVYYSNELIGKTHKGNILIPSLTSYADNYLSIEAEDIPVDYAIKTARKIITPKLRTGSVADFGVEKFQGFVGYLFLKSKGKRQSADYAELDLVGTKQQLTSTVGRNGEFYFENLQPGKYLARVTLEGRQCQFQMQIPESEDMMVELGEQDCEM
ncbi:MAG: fimbria/pilus outer membrane usher protein [Gammaproteobacteria bacterium]|nr:fimbria/pilus outer membrane usher protein [Gammaproteobacteria bacterium]